MSEQQRPDLDELERLEQQATPGPWYVRFLDDDYAMNLTAISTVPDTGAHEQWPDFDSGEIVAATLVQQPRYVDVADEKWDENANLIAALRNAAPWLIARARQADTLERTLAAERAGADWLAWARDAAALVRTYTEGDDECRCASGERCTHCRGADLVERAGRLGIAAATTD